MRFSLKVIACLQSGPWNFQKLQNDPYPLPPPPCSVSRRRPPTAPHAGAVESLPGHYFASRCHPRVAPELLPLLLPRAGAPRPCHARRRCPEAPAPPPPRRRRGEPKPEAQLSIFRAPEHYKKPRALFLSSFRRFPNPTPQNASAAPPNAGELKAAVAPPFQSRSAQIGPTSSFASTPHSSPTLSPRQSLTGAPPPPFSSAADRLLASSRRLRAPPRNPRPPRGAPWAREAHTPLYPRRG